MLKSNFLNFCLFILVILQLTFTKHVFCINPDQLYLSTNIDIKDELNIYELKQELEINSNTNNTEAVLRVYNLIIDFYESNQEYENAVLYQDKLIHINDSLNSIEKAKVLAEIQSQFEAVQQDKEIAIANAKNDSQESKIEQQNLQRIIYYSGGLLVLIIVLGLLSRLYYMRKNRIELVVKSKKIAIEKKRAEENEKVKEQFLAKMSHEIRTPMNAIMGITNILRKKKHYKSQAKYLDAIWKSSENLLVILNDIIDLSKLESGKIKIEKIQFKPLDELMKLRELLKYKAEEKGIELICDLDEKIPERLLGDPIRLNQILVNLVGNAIKFTNEGKVFVSIQLKNVSDNDALIEVEIRDTGIGIPKEHIDKIFESFIQADSDTTRKYAGTGLGLTISRDLVQLQGGKINVDSELGKGSVFSFEIPYELAEMKPEVIVLNEGYSYQLKGLSVLLVEDNEFNIMVAKDELNEIIDDVKIDIADNGKQAVDMVMKNKYDIILMDIEMEEMNGYEAAKAIRELDEPRNAIPIIAITASALKRDIEKCFEAGMNDHIAKPFAATELKSKIEAIFINNTV